MSLHIEPLSSLPQLRGLLEVTRLVRDERDLTRLVDGIAETISESLGWSTVAINLYRPAEGDFEVTTVHGNEAARAALLGTTRPGDAWTPLMADRFLRRGAYFIPHDEAVWAGLPSHVPELSISSDPDAWHPEDALDRPDAWCRRDAARRRVRRRTRIRLAPLRRGARCARGFCRACDRGVRGGPGRRRGHA